MQRATAATLSTVALDPAGFPHGSLVTVACDATGRPLLLLSTLAEHTKNLDARSDSSILVTEAFGLRDQPLAVGRVTILGHCRRVPDDEVGAVRETFLALHPSAASYASFKDFAFFRLEPIALRYVGGFGRMSWVTAETYRDAEPDPLAGFSAGVLTHMNDDHGSAVLSYAKVLGGVGDASSATMTAVDRYGFDLAVVTPGGPRALRIAFDEAVETSDEVRRAMVALVKRCREREG